MRLVKADSTPITIPSATHLHRSHARKRWTEKTGHQVLLALTTTGDLCNSAFTFVDGEWVSYNITHLQYPLTEDTRAWTLE